MDRDSEEFRSSCGQFKPSSFVVGGVQNIGQRQLDKLGHLKAIGVQLVALLRDEPLDLTALEFAILLSLMKAKGRVKSREVLLEEVSERRFDVFDRSIDVHISQLR